MSKTRPTGPGQTGASFSVVPQDSSRVAKISSSRLLTPSCYGESKVSATSDSDGTNTSVRSAASFSLMNKAAKVFPVPQAMISCPR